MWKLRALVVLCFFQLSAGFKFVGCYVDQNDRDISEVMKDLGTENSVETCVTYCTNRGYKYAGLQHSTQCFCGESFGKYGKADVMECDMACPVDNAQRCGGNWRNAIYTTNYLGCWRDSRTRVLTGHPAPYEMPVYIATIPTCVKWCKNRGYKYAGAQFFNQCFCGSSYSRYGEVERKHCDSQCNGDTSQACGGAYLSSIYDTGVQCGCSEPPEVEKTEVPEKTEVTGKPELESTRTFLHIRGLPHKRYHPGAATTLQISFTGSFVMIFMTVLAII